VARRRRAGRRYTDVLELDLGTVEPSLAGPKRPQDRVPLRSEERLSPQRASRKWPRSARKRIPTAAAASAHGHASAARFRARTARADRRHHQLHQHLQSRVLMAAGLLARNARARA
jgi:aconitate hydratase